MLSDEPTAVRRRSRSRAPSRSRSLHGHRRTLDSRRSMRASYESVVEITASGVSAASSAEQQQRAQGSGFVYDANGHLITNQHVVEGATSISVRFSNGSTQPARLVGTDPSTDLAVIKVDAPVSPDPSGSVTRASSPSATPSSRSEAHSGSRARVTSGHRERAPPADDGAEQLHDHRTRSRPTRPSTTGTPEGRFSTCAGGSSASTPRSRASPAESDGVGFAIPSNTVRSIVSQLIESGEVAARLPRRHDGRRSRRAWPSPRCGPGTPAEQAGLRAADGYAHRRRSGGPERAATSSSSSTARPSRPRPSSRAQSTRSVPATRSRSPPAERQAPDLPGDARHAAFLELLRALQCTLRRPRLHDSTERDRRARVEREEPHVRAERAGNELPEGRAERPSGFPRSLESREWPRLAERSARRDRADPGRRRHAPLATRSPHARHRRLRDQRLHRAERGRRRRRRAHRADARARGGVRRARGRATFTLDDETLDAPAGTVVFVRDPQVKRHARADGAEHVGARRRRAA